MATAEKKTLPLVKGQSSYKIIIPADVERQIRFLCERVWDTEWSGVLFYTPSGDFEDGSLEIRCVDILPMDIGNATYTEFDMSPDVISYMAQNPELLDCKMGLIHSHNNMSTFFSGTDTATLAEEGKDRNHFVSLIVNNAGKYTAAITRKIQYHSVRDLSYEGFNGTVKLDQKEESDGEEIEYFNLEIVFEEPVEDKFKGIADRLSEIKKEKAKKPITTSNIYKGNYSNALNSYGAQKYKTPSLFDEDDYKDRMLSKSPYDMLNKPSYDADKWKPAESSIPSKGKGSLVTDEDVESAVNQLITGSVTIYKLEKDTRDRLLKNVDARFSARFGKDAEGFSMFKLWATDFIEFILWYTIDADDYDPCAVVTEFAKKLVTALKKLPSSKYVNAYIDLLNKYAKPF